MAKRGIDMLPLLDVFMVVLFVFATIQEQQLDSSVQTLDEVSQALAQTTAERDQQLERVEQLDAELERLTVQATRARALDELVERYESECGPRAQDGPVCPPASLNPDAHAQAAMAALQERLLDNIAVFEVDIEGLPDLGTGEIRNRCCYRADPPRGEWQSCGEVPTEEAALITWLDDGADNLIDGLNRTRGGNAVVLLRQGDEVRYRLTNDLAELLRGRLSSHRIYDDGINAGEPRCAADR
jgi:hypothetical protein